MTSPCKHGRLMYAAGADCADMLYGSGVMTPDPFLWYQVPAAHEPAETGIVLSALEITRARSSARAGVTALSMAEARKRWGLPATATAPEEFMAALAAWSGIGHWQVPAGFPFALARKLQDRDLTLEPIPIFFPDRRAKTAAEVDHVRAGIAVAEAALERALDILRNAVAAPDGVLRWQDAVLTADILRGEIDVEIVRRGGSARHTIAAPGRQGADPHAVGSGPVRAGEPIVIDIFPRVQASGYWGDLTRTVVKGAAADVVQRAHAAVQAAQQQALAAIRAGVTAASVHAAAAETLAGAGFETDTDAAVPRGFFHGLGHGLGLEVHEAPRVSANTDTRLAAGDVITVEPGLYYPEWGGVRIEDVAVVEAEGCRNLTRAVKDLIVV